MDKKKLKLRFRIVAMIIAGLILLRLIPHAPNFTPILAATLLGGTYFYKKKWVYIIPMITMVVSDYFIYTFVYDSKYAYPNKISLVVYGCILLTGFMGTFMRNNVNFVRIIAYSLISSFSFFAITNFFVWLGSTGYPQTAEGLAMCYTAAIPFFKNTLLSSLIYSGIFYIGFHYLQKKFPVLKVQVP